MLCVSGGGCTAEDGAAKEGSRKEKDEWCHLCWALVLIKKTLRRPCVYVAAFVYHCVCRSTRSRCRPLSRECACALRHSVYPLIKSLSHTLTHSLSISISRSLGRSLSRARAPTLIRSLSLTLTLSLALSLARSVARSGFSLPPAPFPLLSLHSCDAPWLDRRRSRSRYRFDNGIIENNQFILEKEYVSSSAAAASLAL